MEALKLFSSPPTELGEDTASIAAVAQNYFEEAQALLQALDVLSQLAAMDNADYHGTLTGRSSPISINEVFQLEATLASIQKQWKLEQTPIPSLASSIQRLHSNLTTLQTESEKQNAEILALTKKNLLLQKSVLVLQKRDKQQGAKLSKHREEKKALLNQVKHYAQQAELAEIQQKELQDINAAYKMKAHEQLLSQCIRCSTRNLGCGETVTTMSTGTEDDSSIHTDSTSSTLVTDEGVATVKLGLSPPPVTLTLGFLRGGKMGIKILSVPVDDETPRSPQQKQSMLPRKHPKGILSLDLLEEGNEGKSMAKAATVAPGQNSKTLRNCFVVVGFSDSFDTKQNPKHPPLGSRIVAVNGHPVSESLTMKTFMQLLAQASTCKTNIDSKITFTVTFRCDPLTKKQIDWLKRPSSPAPSSPVPHQSHSQSSSPATSHAKDSTTQAKTTETAILDSRNDSIRNLSSSSDRGEIGRTSPPFIPLIDDAKSSTQGNIDAGERDKVAVHESSFAPPSKFSEKESVRRLSLSSFCR